VAGAEAATAPHPLRPSRMAFAVTAAALLGALAVGVTVFSGGSGAGAPKVDVPASGSLAASGSDSAAARSVAFTVSATEATPGTVSTLLTGTGSFDLAKEVGRLTATVPSASSVLGGGNDSLTVLAEGDNLYVDAPGLSPLTGGKGWLEASVGHAPSIGGSAGTLPLTVLADPTRALALLGNLGGTVTKVGPVRLDGATTTEYRATLSVAAIVSRLDSGASSSATAKAAARALQQLDVPTIPITAWVGRDGLLRQVTVAVDASYATLSGLLGILSPPSVSTPTASASGSTLTLTVGFSGYGAPVSISVPASSDTINVNTLFSSAGGAFSRVGHALLGIVGRV
jgi:hypothetical protein